MFICLDQLFNRIIGFIYCALRVYFRIRVHEHVHFYTFSYSDYCEKSLSEADQLMGAMDKGEYTSLYVNITPLFV